MSKKRIVLMLCSLAACAGSAMAGFANEDAPSWRGDAGSVYYNWEDFTSADGFVDGPNFPTNEPFPSGNAMLFNFGAGAIISGDNNIYGFGGPLDIHTYAYTQSDAEQVVMNISTAGSEMLYNAVGLFWVGADGSSGYLPGASYSMNYYEEADFGGFTGAYANVSYAFDLSFIGADIREIGVIFEGSAAHMSLDAVSMDILTVPAPGALALLGLATLGRGRRRRH